MPKESKRAFTVWLEYLLARLIVFHLEFMPRPLADRLGALCGQALDYAIPRLRQIARKNLNMAARAGVLALDSAACEQITNEVFVSIGRLLVSFARLPSIHAVNVKEWIDYQGFEHFEKALARGKGVLFATAHFGNWELSAFAHALMSGPMSIVVRPLDNPLIDAFVERRRALSGNRIILKKDARPILKALAENQAVGILVDQNASLEEGAFVDFFGTSACAHTGLAKLAAHSGAAVLPGFAIWHPGQQRYTLRFYPEVPITGDAAEDTRQIQQRIQEAIAEHPGQWLWIHRRWKTRPPGQPAIY